MIYEGMTQKMEIKTDNPTQEKQQYDMYMSTDGGRTSAEVEVTNMTMVYDRERDMVLVQDRLLYWKGIAFPGGHLEPGESLRDSAIREVKEETGLDVKNLTYCGMLHWYNTDDGKQTFIYYYRTEDFSGELLPGTEEGRNMWVPYRELRGMKLAPGFEKQIDMFTNDCMEIFITYNNHNDEEIYYPQ